MFTKQIVNRRNTYATFTVIVIGAFVYFSLQHSELIIPYYKPIEPHIIRWTATENITCHYVKTNDVLEAFEEDNPAENSIYFLETSCRGGLNTRQACAVESAARSNPDRTINVLFSSPVTQYILDRGCLAVLSSINNVRLKRVHIKEFVKSTPVEKLVETGALNKSFYPVVHTSDVLRILTLYKWGGVYLDTDVIIVRNISPLGPNWAAREDGTWVANGILAFSRDKVGRAVANAAIRELETDFKGSEWAYNGPGLMTRARNKMCGNGPNLTTTAESTAICEGFKIYGPENFYPIHWSIRNKYFDPGELDPEKTKNAYGHHVWNALTKNLAIPPDSPYAKLAKQYCPSIYQLYGDKFGA